MTSSNTISNSTINAGRDTSLSTHYHYNNPDFDPFEVLQGHAALGALYDSAERPDPPQCHLETREAILERINRWAQDRSPKAKPVLWLTGAAGAGKAAIAQTLVERWMEERLIVPNFFFWRTSPKRNCETHLISTIAFQLTKMLPATGIFIRDAIRDRSIFQQRLKSQVEHLIVNPLNRASDEAKGSRPEVIVVIDGLDKCRMSLPPVGGFPGQDFEEQQREMLDAIAFASLRVPSLRILIASRPERQIRTSFSETPFTELSLCISLNDDTSVSNGIQLYLESKLGEIRSRHPGIDSSWPSRAQIAQLVEKSSGQFIYPSTVVKYIACRRQYPPTSLDEVLALKVKSADRRNHPLADVNALYTLVLMSVSAESKDPVETVLGFLCYINDDIPDIFRFSSPGHYLPYFERLLDLSAGELAVHLTDLHLILFIPDYQDREAKHIRFMHATLSEYLRDRARSMEYHISKEDTYLRCSLLLLKHAKLQQQILLTNQRSKASHRHRSYHSYTSLNPVKTLALFADSSPPSKELMEGLWDIARDEIGEYSLRSERTAESQKGADDIRQRSPGSPKAAVDLSLLPVTHRISIFRYLLTCNIPDIEPSGSHRQRIDRRLREAIWRIDPNDSMGRASGLWGWLGLGLINSLRAWMGW